MTTTHAFKLQSGDVIPYKGRSATVLSVSDPKPHGLGKMYFVDIQLKIGETTEWYSPDANQLVEYTRPVHRATPAVEFAEDAESVCIHCHRDIKRVPGGHGPTWVHADTGAVVGSSGERQKETER